MSKQVIIVGAGPGGLASAILLAAAGMRVKILERLPILGGRTSRIESDGFTFDLGPTFFLYPRVLEEVFAAAGTCLRNEVEGVYLVGGGTHPGSGLPVIFESARISSRLLLEDLGAGSAPSRGEACDRFAGSGDPAYRVGGL